MEKRSSPAAKVFAILFAILFVITGVMTLFIFNAFNQAFNPDLYINSLADADIYQKLPQLIGDQMVFQFEHDPCAQDPAKCPEGQSSTLPIYLKSMDSSEWAAVISKLIDPSWLQSQTESAIKQVFKFIKSPGQPFTMDLSLKELKTKLGGEDGYQAFLLFIKSLEPCTAEQLMELSMGGVGASNIGEAELCRPSDSMLSQGEDAMRTILKDMSSSLPDSTAELLADTSSSMTTEMAGSLRRVQTIRLIIMLSPLIPLLLLLIITLLVVRNLKSFLSWWGIPLTITGGLVMIASLFIIPFTRSFLLGKIISQKVMMTPELTDMIKTLLLNVMKGFASILLIHAGILTLAGIVMIILSVVIKPKTKPEKAA